MPGMNIFADDAFDTIELTAAIQERPYRPQLLGSLNLFEVNNVRQRNVMVERTKGGLRLIPTSADGSPPAQIEKEGRDLVNLRTTRLAESFTLYATELDGIRAFGTMDELMAVQAEYMKRADRLNDDMELTHEFHRLGALQGVLLDADGTTVIYDYSEEFNEAIPAPISLGLDDPDAPIRKTLKQMIRGMARQSGGLLTGASIHALAGDELYDDLISHPQLEKFYLNQQAATEAARKQEEVFDSFTVGNVTFHNYRGTDDNSTVAIPENEAKVFPVGARDVFSVAYAPHESMEFINTPGQRVYAMNVRDVQRDLWTSGEIYSYPLYMCQKPSLLRKIVR